MIGSQFNYYDLSQIEEIEEVTVQDNSPLILASFGADKGTEEMFTMAGTDFIKMFGQPDYKAYGQTSVQARRVIDAGGTIIGKRVVADDATLANAIISAKVYVDRKQKVDSNGNKLFLNANGDEVTQASTSGTANAAIIVPTVHVSYEASSVPAVDPVTGQPAGAKNVEDIKVAMTALLDETGATVDDLDNEITPATATEPAVYAHVKTLTEDAVWSEVDNDYTAASYEDVKVFTYPLFAIFDCGRGVSNKRFRIIPENKLSKNLSFMYYTATIIENGDEIESVTFSIVPDTIVNGTCIDLNSVAGSTLTLAGAYQDEDAFAKFVSKIEDLAGIDSDVLEENDPIFMTNRKGQAFASVVIDSDESVNLAAVTGIGLDEGTNGIFGDNPASDTTTTITYNNETMTVSKLYYRKMLEFFNGTFTEDIYDLDSYQIDAFFDSALPKDIKKEIARLAEYRKDFIFFRDLNDELKEVNSLEAAEGVRDDEVNFPHAWWITDYMQTYDVIDIYSKKQINVSIMYDIAPMMIQRFLDGRNIPFAGERNNAIIDSIVKGTLNYKPRVTPNVNEKDELEDIRVNFGTYYGTDFILETLYTSQDINSQLSFSNNVMALQQVMKALRVTFPAIRYAFITSTDDIGEITSQINNMLEAYSGMFSELTFEYTGDAKYISSKIYKAKISFRFGQFIQAEIVDAYALPTIIE